MKLDEFLSSAGTATPAPVKHVTFKVIGKGLASPELLSAEVEAAMAFVSESERQQANRDAHQEMRKLYGDQPIPKDRLEDEIVYHFLHRALKDSQSPNYLASFASSVEGLKKALILRTANELYDQYNEFVRSEFPDFIDAEDFQKLIVEAEGKSMADLLSEHGFSSILRALPSLAAHFGK